MLAVLQELVQSPDPIAAKEQLDSALEQAEAMELYMTEEFLMGVELSDDLDRHLAEVASQNQAPPEPRYSMNTQLRMLREEAAEEEEAEAEAERLNKQEKQKQMQQAEQRKPSRTRLGRTPSLRGNLTCQKCIVEGKPPCTGSVYCIHWQT